MSSKYRKVDYDIFALAVREAKQKAGKEAWAAQDGTAVEDADVDREIEKAAVLGVAVLQNELIKLFAEDNPKFNKLLFIEACGHGGEHVDAPAPKP